MLKSIVMRRTTTMRTGGDGGGGGTDRRRANAPATHARTPANALLHSTSLHENAGAHREPTSGGGVRPPPSPTKVPSTKPVSIFTANPSVNRLPILLFFFTRAVPETGACSTCTPHARA